MITGTDLVEWQLEVAAGNRIPKLQEDLFVNGWSFETRIYAENPSKNFMPDTGTLIHMSPPEPSEQVRIETGVQQGDEVSVHYDPMISKLVVWGKNRTESLRVLRKALGEFEVVGPNTNIEFLKSLSSHPSFVNGEVDTGFIKRHYDELFPPREPVKPIVIAQAALFYLRKQRHALFDQSTSSPWNTLSGFRINHNFTMNLKFKEAKDDHKTVSVDLEESGDGQILVTVRLF